MNLRSLLTGLLAIALSASLSQQSAAQSLDETLLNISLREDPVYPAPEIGQRRFFCRYQAEFQWNEPRMILRFARQSVFLEKNFPDPNITEIPAESIAQQDIGNSIRQATYIMPWRKRDPGKHNLTGPEELFADGSSGFYQWVVEYISAGETKRHYGDIHTFTMPRRLVFGIMGDSFGSGEGAPQDGAGAWLNFAAHRSKHSGGEVAISLFRNTYPNLAFDYVNTTSSGAIAHDIYSQTGQSNREGTDGQGIGTPQANLLEEFLGKPEFNFNTLGYKHVDAIILSCGGNDMGFSTILGHYFGIPVVGLGTAAGACATFLAIPYAGPALFIACIAIVLEADYSFEEGYDAPFVSEGGFRAFPFYRDRLKLQYEVLEHRLVQFLRPGTDPQRQTSAKVHQFLVTEYPNPLKPCKSHWDYDRPLRYLPIPLPLHISEDEAVEVNNKLAVQTFNTQTPTSGGLNHIVRDTVKATDQISEADWKFVQTAHLVAYDGGVCHSGRQFAERWEAYDMAGPNPENNAMHPNRKGHAQVYAPAIRAALDQAVSPAYRQSRATAEGIRPGNTLLPDLLIFSFVVTNFDAGSGQVTFRANVRNDGGVASDPGLLKVNARSADDVSFLVKLGEISVPAIQPVALGPQLDFTLTIPNHPAFRKLPVGCFKAGANFNAAAYELKDRALTHWFIQESRLQAVISTPSKEINTQNNSIYAVDSVFQQERTWKIGPKITTAELNSVLYNFAIHRGLTQNGQPFAAVADIRLNDNYDLAFFGFCDPVQKYVSDNGNIIAVTDLISLVDGVSSDLNPFEDYGNPNLRNFCTGNQGSYATSQLGSLIEGGVATIAEVGVNPGHDGHPTPVVLKYPGIGGQVVETTINAVSPPKAVGLANPPPTEPISGQRVSFPLNVPAKAVSYRAMAGPAPGRSDFHDPGLVPTRREATDPPVSHNAALDGLPADGRTWFLTIETLLEDGKELINVYKFESQSLNARLLSPVEGLLPEGTSPVLHWQPGTVAAESYRVRIGSTPGGWDIFGVDPLSSSTIGVVSGRTTQISIPSLPRDGREIFITLETKRGGGWFTENYRTNSAMTEEPGMIYPLPGTPLGGRVVVRLHPGDPETSEILLFAGTRPGANDLYPGATRNLSTDELIWDFTLPAPGAFPPPVYITAQSNQDPLRRTQWVFTRSKNSSLLAPSPDVFTSIPIGDVPFTLQRGNNVAGHMLTVGTTPGGNQIAEWISEADVLSTTVKIPESSAGRLVYVSVHSIRLEGENGLEEYVIPVSSSNPLYANDGIDDFLQAMYFGPNNPLGAANVDFNGNGDSNLVDVLAGLDPRTPDIRWDRRSEITPSGKVRFPMPATVPGTRYRIQRSKDLVKWSDHGEPIEVESATPNGVIERRRRTDPIKEFYRLVLEPKE